nr:MAG TPA_asm: hypothetical protein [Bacteriophage sp.]
MEASAAPDANLDTTRPAMGRVFCVHIQHGIPRV